MNIYSSKPSLCSKYKANFKVNEISKLYYVFENETLLSQNLIAQIYVSRNNYYTVIYIFSMQIHTNDFLYLLLKK